MQKIIKKNYVLIALSLITSTTVMAQAETQQASDGGVRLGLSQSLAASPTLKKIRDTGVVRVGFRQVAPISYDVNGKATGYAVEICNEVIEDIKNYLDLRNVKTEYYQVTAQQRMGFLQNGQIDMECGITTNTSERRNTVSFSIPYFITGTKMLVQKQNENKYKSINDLAGKNVGTVKNTTAVGVIDKLNKQRLLDLKNQQQDSYEDGVAKVAKGEIQALISDELILEDMKLKSSNPSALVVAGGSISVEPLAIMIRKEKAFQDVINQSVSNIIHNGRLESIYQKWFKRAVPPDNINYNIEISAGLREIIRMPNDIVGN